MRPTCWGPGRTSPPSSAAAHAAGALVYVDGVHLTPHAPVDVAALGADFFACSPYKFFGPHLGALVADPALLRAVHPDKLLPSTDAVPERFELGTLPYELLAGVTATVDFIADLVPGAGQTAGPGSLASMAARRGARGPALRPAGSPACARLDRVTLHGSPARHTPTVLFSVDGRHRARGLREARRRAVSTRRPAASTPSRRPGGWGSATPERCAPGWRRTPTAGDVDRLLAGVAELSR